MFLWVVSVPKQYEHFTLISFILRFKEMYFSSNMVAKTQANDKVALNLQRETECNCTL